MPDSSKEKDLITMKPASQSFRNILLADDDLDDSSLFAEALEELGTPFSFKHVEDGEELLNHLQNNSLPDIIFLDLNMPGKNGRECLQEIRTDDRFSEIPVVIYSTSNGKRDIDACYNGGANFYFVKPDNFSEIVKRLKKLFAGQVGRAGSTPKEQFVI